MDKNNYFIKRGYKRNIQQGKETFYDGIQDYVEQSLISQYRVYEYARDLIKKNNIKSVLDIGCGVATKLEKLILPICKEITGIDENETIKWCRQNYKWGDWYMDNLEQPKLMLKRKYDLIICSDVIEHLMKPEKLLEMIKHYADKDTFIILSTPDRDIIYGKKHMGAPPNLKHYQEWNKEEFHKYIEYSGFEIVKHFRVETPTPMALVNGNIIAYVVWKMLYSGWKFIHGKSILPEGQVVLAKCQK
jgi:predicted TPR repeat methyltransferase